MVTFTTLFMKQYRAGAIGGLKSKKWYKKKYTIEIFKNWHIHYMQGICMALQWLPKNEWVYFLFKIRFFVSALPKGDDIKSWMPEKLHV